MVFMVCLCIGIIQLYQFNPFELGILRQHLTLGKTH